MPWEAGKPTVEQVRVCLACPVLAECADGAIRQAEKRTEDAGVFAAASVGQRDEVRRGMTSWEDVWARARARVEQHDRLVERRLVRWMLSEATRIADAAVAS